MFKKASEENLLEPLARRALQHQVSLYADDVVIFLKPSAVDIDKGLPDLLVGRYVWENSRFFFMEVHSTHTYMGKGFSTQETQGAAAIQGQPATPPQSNRRCHERLDWTTL
jgi:hypothetical protein